jgi:hypothetical protein
MSGHTSFHDAIHGGFLGARRTMHNANEAVEIAKRRVEAQNIAMNEAKTSHRDLLVLVRRRRATSSQLSAFKKAKILSASEKACWKSLRPS